ncbi:MAG TPA: rhomboid family intramembrane serine protease [Steroidobacteraceae bacterium]|jgi:rhomboid protease GluP|nr:rhomboid family intramembrane serine protease [Steroidobacteraceae bacterium]
MSDTTGWNADGTVDYSNYTEEQLSRVLLRIDAEKYPLNFANVKAELAARRFVAGAAAADPALASTVPGPAVEFAVKFAPESGPMTWLGPSRNDFRLVGNGTVSCDSRCLEVRGRRFGFILGLPLKRRLTFDIVSVVNVEREENVVRLECARPNGRRGALPLWFKDAGAAEGLVKLLPPQQTLEFVPQLPELLEFEQRLSARAPGLPMTYGLFAMCVLMFIVTLLNGATWFASDGVAQMNWGANYGPFTISGQWWRLLTYSLLHIGVVHLTFNMWALVSFGAVAERLYGSFRYALICVAASVVAGLASVVANPAIVSAGVSGVIFGIFGALLAAHLSGESIPRSVGRSLRNSTLVFTVVALIGGFIIKGVDNAAHLGGLAAGFCAGLAFQSPRVVVRIAAPAALATLALLAAVMLHQRAFSATGAEKQYWETLRWFALGEESAVKTWAGLQKLAASSQIDDDGLAARIDKELIPFWTEASARFKPIKPVPGTKLASAHDYLQSLAEGRLHAFQTCVIGLRKHDNEIARACVEEMRKGDQLVKDRLAALAKEN